MKFTGSERVPHAAVKDMKSDYKESTIVFQVQYLILVP